MMENNDQVFPDAELKDMMDVEELARYLRVPKSWIYERTSKKSIPYHKIGKLIRFTREDIKALLDASRRGPVR